MLRGRGLASEGLSKKRGFDDHDVGGNGSRDARARAVSVPVPEHEPHLQRLGSSVSQDGRYMPSRGGLGEGDGCKSLLWSQLNACPI